MSDSNTHSTIERRSDDMRALSRLCQYVAKEAERLGLPEAQALGLSVSRFIDRSLKGEERH